MVNLLTTYDTLPSDRGIASHELYPRSLIVARANVNDVGAETVDRNHNSYYIIVLWATAAFETYGTRCVLGRP